jgi:hypothetical protein
LNQNYYFGGGAAGTDMHPLVLVLTLLAFALVLFVPRRYAFAPAVCAAVLLPFGSQLYVGGLHFYVVRIMAVAGILRLILDKYGKRLRLLANGFTPFDWVFVAWAIVRGLALMLLHPELGAVVNSVAFWLDVFGIYFLFRLSIRKEGDVLRIAKVLAPVMIIVAACMLFEHRSGSNPYNLITSYQVTPYTREGKLRAQAAFGHAITAGTFGATMIPVFFWAWKSGRVRWAAIMGVTASLAAIYASLSSTPASAFLACVLGLSLWPLRMYMQQIRWSIAGMIALLALVMKAPVWYIIQRVDFVGGHGWDRAFLVDQFMQHISEWWLVGSDENAKWSIYGGTWDRCNQYVAEGLSGGLLTLVLFMVLLAMAFSIAGRGTRRARGVDRWLYWCLGSALLAHIAAFWGVSYWDQMRVPWLMLLAVFPAAQGWSRAKGSDRRQKLQAGKSPESVATAEDTPVEPQPEMEPLVCRSESSLGTRLVASESDHSHAEGRANERIPA